MIIKIFIFLLSNFLNAQSIDLSIEKNISRIKNNFSYFPSDSFVVSKGKEKNDYRIRMDIKNDLNKEITALVIKYSFKLNLRKNGRSIQTISIFTSSIRVSDIKAGQSKIVYIYETKNIFSEIKKVMSAGYEIVDVVFDIMVEPKKDIDIFVYSKTFPVKVE
jgi:hypothetical protein